MMRIRDDSNLPPHLPRGKAEDRGEEYAMTNGGFEGKYDRNGGEVGCGRDEDESWRSNCSWTDWKIAVSTKNNRYLVARF